MPNEYGNALAQMTQTLEAQRESVRKERAYNALRTAYGDIAGDPAAAINLQNHQQSAQAFPLEQQQRELANTQLGQGNADDANAAKQGAILNMARFVQSAIDNKRDPLAAFDQVAPNLQLAPDVVAKLRADLERDPTTVADYLAQADTASDSNRWQVIQAPDGSLYRATATGAAEPMRDPSGKPLSGYQAPQGQQRIDNARLFNDPATRGAQATATAAGTAAGQASAELPIVENSYEAIKTRITALKENPALDAIYGSPTVAKFVRDQGLGSLGAFPGSPAADAAAELTALNGQIRSMAYETLKGGGPIATAESEFAAAAFANLERAQSKDSALAELAKLETFLDNRMNAYRVKAGQGAAAPQGGESPNTPDTHEQPGGRIRLKYNMETGEFE